MDCRVYQVSKALQASKVHLDTQDFMAHQDQREKLAVLDYLAKKVSKGVLAHKDIMDWMD
jgi:hypothetical protein